MLFPKKPFFERKNNVDGFDLPYSFKPINVKSICLFSKINLLISDIDVGLFKPACPKISNGNST